MALSLFAGCAASPTEEAKSSVDGQAQDVITVKCSDFAVDEDGNVYYSKRGNPGEMVRRDADGEESTIGEWGGPIILSGDWLFYRSVDNKFYKVKTDGSENTLLRDEYTNGSMILIGDWVYFKDYDYGYSISRIDSNGDNLQRVSDHDCNRFVDYKNNWLYYVRSNYEYKENKETNTQFSLYKIRADGTDDTLISDYNSTDVFIEGDSIYYYIYNLDGYDDDMYRTDLNGGNLTQLHILPQDGTLPYEVAVKDGWVYYSYFTGGFYDGSDLHRVRTDGTGDEVIFEGQVKDLEFSGGWMFCFDEETGYWYKAKPDGTEREQLYPDSMIVTGPGIPEE